MQRIENAIPRGNTAPGVNREIIESVRSVEPLHGGYTALDIPCGNGEFLDTLKVFFPVIETTGLDVKTPPDNFKHQFVQFDASRNEAFPAAGPFDLITCISGVMEFDNTSFFLSNLREVLKDDGLLIVTNDNILTVRDRLLYLLFGRFGQFPFSTAAGNPTWKILPIQNLLRVLYDSGFNVEDVRYVPVSPAEWLWTPLALVLFIAQRLYSPQGVLKEMVRKVFTFRSLVSRH
ncbi:MAG: class I SAM-dependent methyltransferase, partial [Acidobacteriota bacterium]